MGDNKSGLETRGFSLDYRQDGIYLMVLPQTEYKININITDIVNYLTKKQVKDANIEKIKEVLMRRDGLPGRIADPQQEVKIDATARVKVEEDRMSATIIMIPPEDGDPLTSMQIIELLKLNKVVFGVDSKVIERLTNDPAYYQEIAIAQGIPPVNGKNGTIQYHFNYSKDRTPKILEDGRVDFRDLNLIENVKAGDLLATVVPPVPGINGRNVMGQELNAISGKPAVLPKGKNVYISEDGTQLFAAIDGQVVLFDRKVNVYTLYEVPGNVDNSTGNISFVGNVIIKGNVLTGFTVEAGGTVEIQGVVEGAVIKAGGDIILRRGMQGMGRGILISEGNIIARYIEHSNLTAKGDVKCEAIMHSTVRCGGIMELSGKKGLFVGGAAKVGREIKAKFIGSPMETATELEVGVDPVIRERFKELKEEIASMESEILKADQAIELLRRLEAINKLDLSKQIILSKSVNTKNHLSQRILEQKEEFAEIEARLIEEGSGKIKCLNTIYPGTKVAIGTCMMYIKKNTDYCTLFKDRADIRVGPFEK